MPKNTNRIPANLFSFNKLETLIRVDVIPIISKANMKDIDFILLIIYRILFILHQFKTHRQFDYDE